MLGVAKVPHRSRKVTRANEQGIDAVHGTDFGDVVDGLDGLNLHNVADLIRRLKVVVRVCGTVIVPAIVRKLWSEIVYGGGACVLHALQAHHAADSALLGVSGGRNSSPGLLGVLDHGEDDGLCANVQDPLHHHGVVPRDPDLRVKVDGRR